MKNEITRIKPSKCDGCGHKTPNTYYLRRARIELILCERCLKAIKTMSVIYINTNKYLNNSRKESDVGHE